jgi:hypothetical protein
MGSPFPVEPPWTEEGYPYIREWPTGAPGGAFNPPGARSTCEMAALIESTPANDKLGPAGSFVKAAGGGKVA